MCGIAGYRLEGRDVSPHVLGAMVDTLVHRGPDMAASLRAGPMHVGMRRLAINDLGHGQQPLFNAARTVALFYNGEIYNYPTLRRDLEARGHQFRTHCDGEVICHLYDELGEDLFERLDGMFAAALLVLPERRLVLARDLPGEKPLYYAPLPEGGVAFASEIPALTRFPGINLSLNRQALWDFPSFLWVPEPATVYTGIRALERGHLLVADDRGIRIRPYANRFNSTPLDLSAVPDDRSDATVVAETRRVVEEAVRSRLLADVEVGCFLSSGLDSSIVTTLAAREQPGLTTFSVGFEDVDDPYHGRADESKEAEEYARRLGTRHHCIRVTADGFRRDLATFCRHGGQPFAVSSGLGILAVARAARESGLKVLLSGDGADELFGGYSWYAHLALPDIPSADVAAADISHPVSLQNVGMPLPDRLSALAAYPPPERAWAWHYYAAESEKASLFSRDAFADCATSLRHFDGPGRSWPPEDYIRHDRRFYLPNEMLTKLDRMTMAFSVEGRAPFVAPSVLSHAEKLRLPYMIRDGTLKWSLRRAFSDLLPASVTARPKHGFNVPIDHWLRGRWADLLDATFESNSQLAKLNLLAPDALVRARAMAQDGSRLHGHTLLCYIMLNMWLEQEFHGNHR